MSREQHNNQYEAETHKQSCREIRQRSQEHFLLFETLRFLVHVNTEGVGKVIGDRRNQQRAYHTGFSRVGRVKAGDESHAGHDGVREVAATTRLTLAPEAPLTPGSRYVLRIDGVAVREMHDADGRAFAPIGFPVLVAGTPPPPEPKATPKKKKRRR